MQLYKEKGITVIVILLNKKIPNIIRKQSGGVTRHLHIRATAGWRRGRRVENASANS